MIGAAILRDLFAGHPLARMLSWLALVNGLGPVLAPVLGSQLLRVTDWRGLFLALAIYGLVALLAFVFLIRESLPSSERTSAGWVGVLARFRAVLRDRVFVGIVLVGALAFSSIFTYVSSSPFLLQSLHGLDAQAFGVVFAVNSLGLALSSQLASALMRRYTPQGILSVALVIVVAIGLALVLLSRVGGVWMLIALFFVLLVTCGTCLPCVQVIALSRHGEQAGTAAALLGTAFSVLSAVVSPIPGMIGLTSGAPVGLVVLAVLVLWAVVRPRTLGALAP